MALQYSFIPVVRRGLARAYAAVDGSAGLTVRPQVQVTLAMAAADKGAAAPDVQNAVTLRLYGPADIIGLDTRLVVRTEPRVGTVNFEPNYLAAVDFDPPDFPWMFTPAMATPEKRLRPWLVLVVFDLTHGGVQLPAMRGGPLPRVTLSAAQARTELPALSESWMWAHGQVVTPGSDPAAIAAALRQAPDQTVSRLVAPRRLQPNTRYVACVVPAFEAGRQAGLGLATQADPAAPAPLAPAWPDDPATRADLDLPVYFHWEFSTAQLGDFETLARRLTTPANYPLPANAELQAQLAKLGTAPVRLDSDKVLTAGGPARDVLYEGALVSLELGTASLPEVDLPDADVAARLADIVNSPSETNLAIEPSERVPTVSPPIYGAWPARQHVVPPAQLNHTWIADLNLDPRFRLAAGYGAEVVRRRQELYMQACWSQVGDVLAAQRLLNIGRLAMQLAGNMMERTIARLPPERILAVLGPARGRLLAGPGLTLAGKVAQASMPNATLDPALRRQFSPQRPALKLAVRRANAASVSAQVHTLYTEFSAASKNLDLVDPTRFVPDGILGTHVYDTVTLPSSGTTIDLGSVLGLPRSESIKTIQSQRAAAKTLARSPVPRPVPNLAAIKSQGVISQDTQVQVAQLAAASGAKLDVATLLRAVVKAPAGAGKSLQITVTQGKSTIDIRPVARGVTPIVALPSSRLVGMASAASPKPSVAINVPRSPALPTLPTLPVPPVRALPKTLTLTVTPPIKDKAVLQKVGVAFTDFSDRVTAATSSANVKITAVDLPLPATAAAMLAAIDPAKTVVQRVNSMLSVADTRLKLSSGGAYSSQAIARRHADLVVDIGRFVIPITVDRVMAYPSIAEATYQTLANEMQDAFLPGSETIPNDFVMLVKTNPRFVESYLVGMNHEMGRELLWRGYPTDQRGTPFRLFWDRVDGKTDIAPIHLWNRNAQLGSQGAASADQKAWLVLLIRGELLRRFPNTIIYAQRKAANGKDLATTADFAEKDLISHPVIGGVMPPDITFVGFPISPDQRQNWCFVVEEQMTEPRFGFDEKDSGRAVAQTPALRTWKDLNWDDVGVAPGSYFGLEQLRHANTLLPPALDLPASAHAGQVARSALQRPFRGFWLSADLEPRV